MQRLMIVPAILMDKEKKYLKYGTEGSIGTKLISVGGNVKKPGVPSFLPFLYVISEVMSPLESHSLAIP